MTITNTHSNSSFQRIRSIPTVTIVSILLLALLLVLVVAPLILLFRTSLAPPGELPFDTDIYTLENYRNALTNDRLPKLIFNTLKYAGGTVIIGVSVAFGIAWLVERTDLPFKATIRTMMFSWMAVPPIVMAFGWILLGNPGNGIFNVLLRWMFDLKGAVISVYSLQAMIFITGLAIVPTAFTMIAGLMRNMDPQLESAGSVHGAGGFSVFRTVTLPLLVPGLLSVGILLFMAMVQAFDLPLVIGLTAKVPVLSTQIFLLANSDISRPDYSLTATFGTFFLLLAAILVLVYFRTVRLSERFRVVSGKAFRPTKRALGSWRLPATCLVALYFLIMMLPFLVLVWTSFLPFYSVPSIEALGRLTFDNYADVFGQSFIIRALVNTIILVLMSATIVMVLSVMIAWISVRSKGRLGKALEVISFMPIAIPPVVLAIAILLIYLRTPLYGTIWIIVLAHVTAYIAFGTRTMNAALIQIHSELENASFVCGAGWFTMLRRIVFPLLLPHILNGWLWVAGHSARDITFPLFLITTSNVVAASQLYILWGTPEIPTASALAVILVGGLLSIVIPVQLFASRLESGRHRKSHAAVTKLAPAE
ncbi:iron ABC transporter permease [Hoeflea sp. WL0058]|uniref:Iron ABC transporter permease n=1 Tax=Flavimaribacter sediminis TaxID=2865987 RepID=A0AAE3D0P1_9HYPH|nr:iron ABC transporter permease [Flavimaribacter sediminis]MBW8638705.1 iron ABC transporter permease [Flavimaribacter sediminis]